jgi:phage/conjugal plasmid C-4 type zinc finger TraR family protein
MKARIQAGSPAELKVERIRLATLREEVGDEVGLGLALADATGELAVLDQDSADGAALLYEREFATHLVGMLDRRAEQVEWALERHEMGSYGLCEICGEPIPRARLQALPEATACVPCQRNREHVSVAEAQRLWH